ncbi:MAG: TorF family putative porin [Alcanivoracaceae bacterium]|nr:TorF family putative porin [Alcanivoracaceae bacterium]
MSKKSLIKMTAMAAAFAATAVPLAASAEISGSLAASSFYLWRGQDVSGGAGAISGSLDYSHETGLYAGMWTSSASPSATGGEYDLYAGFAGEAGGFSYDISYWDYNYPNDDVASVGNSLGDIVVGLGFAGVSATAYIGQGDDVDNEYYTIGYDYDKYGILAGFWANDLADPEDAGYAGELVKGTHVNLTYTPVENLVFTATKMVDEEDGVADDLMFNVAYSFPL